MKTKHAHVCLKRLARQRAENVLDGVKTAQEKERAPVRCILSSRLTKASWPLPAKLQRDLSRSTERSACGQRLVVYWS